MLNFPPSEKLSGVKFNTPNKLGDLLKLKFEKNSFILLLYISKKILGHQYSPCINSYLPEEIVVNGRYKFVRHPIYTANLLLFSGAFLISQSPVLLGLVAMLWSVYYKNAKAEENSLKLSFPMYKEHMKTTGMFFPKISKIAQKA